jgi:hypothetical protein
MEAHTEVGRDSAAQALGLAYVDHLPVLVTEEVGPGLIRDLRRFGSLEHARSG